MSSISCSNLNQQTIVGLCGSSSFTEGGFTTGWDADKIGQIPLSHSKENYDTVDGVSFRNNEEYGTLGKDMAPTNNFVPTSTEFLPCINKYNVGQISDSKVPGTESRQQEKVHVGMCNEEPANIECNMDKKPEVENANSSLLEASNNNACNGSEYNMDKKPESEEFLSTEHAELDLPPLESSNNSMVPSVANVGPNQVSPKQQDSSVCYGIEYNLDKKPILTEWLSVELDLHPLESSNNSMAPCLANIDPNASPKQQDKSVCKDIKPELKELHCVEQDLPLLESSNTDMVPPVTNNQEETSPKQQDKSVCNGSEYNMNKKPELNELHSTELDLPVLESSNNNMLPCIINIGPNEASPKHQNGSVCNSSEYNGDKKPELREINSTDIGIPVLESSCISGVPPIKIINPDEASSKEQDKSAGNICEYNMEKKPELTRLNLAELDLPLLESSHSIICVVHPITNIGQDEVFPKQEDGSAFRASNISHVKKCKQFPEGVPVTKWLGELGDLFQDEAKIACGNATENNISEGGIFYNSTDLNFLESCVQQDPEGKVKNHQISELKHGNPFEMKQCFVKLRQLDTEVINQAAYDGSLNWKTYTPLKKAVKIQQQDDLLSGKSKKKNLCTICGQDFAYPSWLKAHMVKKHKGKFECTTCGKVYKHSRNLAEHKLTHLDCKPYHCSYCGIGLSSKSYVKVHEKLHFDERPYNCEECDKSFISSSQLNYHMMSHTGKRPHRCSHCEKSFKTKQALNYHYSADHGGAKKFQCPQCGMQHITAQSLKYHIRVHTGEKPFKCDQCDRCFSTSSYLGIHKRVHTGEKPFKCPLCDKSFRQRPHLNTHVMTHTGELPFKCSVCGKGFGQSSHLNTHMKVHTGEKPYKCSYCGMCFAHSETRRIHEHGHTGETPHVCKVCGACFKNPSSLRLHIKVHKGDKRYKCSECDAAFYVKAKLHQHKMAVHRNERPHKCNKCGHSFVLRGELNKHMKKHGIYKTYVCELCSKKFQYAHDLRVHKRTNACQKSDQ